MEAKSLAEPVGGHTFKWMQQMASQSKAHIMGSYIVKESGRFYNRLYAVTPGGQAHHYDKKHLFGLAGEDDPYSAGDNRLVFEIDGWRICPMICYDLRFPVWIRSKKASDLLYEYDLLVFVANWPKPRTNAWDTLLQARAIENIAYCAGVNRIGQDGVGADYIGHSAIYDFKGLPMNDMTSNQMIIHQKLSYDDLKSFRERFPFQKDADMFTLD